jgi:thiol-disulfide isomerase/thioredoxin
MTPQRERALMVGLTAAAIGLLFAWQIRPPVPAVHPPEQRKSMPDFTYPSLAQVPWTLNEHQGKVVFVNFWATWCAPCREETPDLVRVHQRYRERGVEFAGVSLDDDPARVAPPFMKRYNIEYPILVAPPDSLLTQAIETIPTSFSRVPGWGSRGKRNSRQPSKHCSPNSRNCPKFSTRRARFGTSGPSQRGDVSLFEHDTHWSPACNLSSGVPPS